VQHMVDNAPSSNVELPEGFHVLPRAEQLPIVVPVRMAISFPILLSAVPVWTIKRAAYDDAVAEGSAPSLRHKDLTKNLFSDGGICSNFPIHFFDAWLPKRPTFGINLTSIPDENDGFIVGDVLCPGPPSTLNPSDVWLPRADEQDNILASDIVNILEFAMAIFHSAQNFRDTTQSQLPSYQERIVNLPLSSLEGGLNLEMDKEIIESMQGKGLQAADILCGEEFSFDHHQWVRLRVLMSLLRENLTEVQKSLNMEPSEKLCKVKKYSEILHKVDASFPFYPNEWNDEVAGKIAAKLEELGALLDRVPKVDFFDPVSPYEIRPELRITPDL